jgi:hypothetical protein
MPLAVGVDDCVADVSPPTGAHHRHDVVLTPADPDPPSVFLNPGKLPIVND